MLIGNFLKKYFYHIVAILVNLLVYGFLFAPAMVVTFSDGTNDTLNFFQLLGYIPAHSWVWILILILYSGTTLLMFIIALFVHYEKGKELFVTINLLVLTAICSGIFFAKEYFSWAATQSVANFVDCGIGWGFTVFIILIGVQILFLVSFVSFASGGVKVMVENAMLVAAAFVLSFIKIGSMPTGGSINLQMLPLMIIALRRGPLSAFLFAGFLYGFLTCFTDGYGFQSFPFDYLMGFGSVAILGLFKPLIMGKEPKPLSKKEKKKNEEEVLLTEVDTTKKMPHIVTGEAFILLGGTLATAVRFFAGCASSMAFYGSNLPSAALYNVGYVFVSGGIAVAGLMMIYPVLRKLR